MLSLKTQNKILPAWSALPGGFLSVLVQSVVLRDALFGQHEAELASGLILAGWLTGSGLGAAIGGRLRRKKASWVCGMLLLPVLGFLHLTCSRSGSLPILLSVIPTGFAAGIVFIQPFSFNASAKTYAFEAVGATAGGILFVLLSSHLLAIDLLAVSLLVAPLAVIWTGSKPGIIYLVLATGFLLSGFLTPVQSWLTGIRFEKFDHTSVFPSPYGEIVLAERYGEYSVYRGGLLETYWPAMESAEDAVVVPLLCSCPESVLYIGSSPVEAGIVSSWPGVDFYRVVVPDPGLVKAASGVFDFPEETVNGDGREYLTRCREKYDLIIVSTGSPLSLLSNRFYTREFISSAAEILTENGILSLGLEGGVNRISPLQARLAGSVVNAGLEVLEWSAVLPCGGGIGLLFGKGEKPDLDGWLLSERLDSLEVRTLYINSGTIPYDLSRERISTLESAVYESATGENRDLYPLAFNIASEIWRIKMGKAGSGNFVIISALLCLIGGSTAVFFLKKSLPGIALFSTGFAGISIVVASVLVIQATLGCSYMIIGAITGIFMAGAALGAIADIKGYFRHLYSIQLLASASALTACFLGFLYNAELIGQNVLAVLFLFVAFVSGITAGASFPLAAGFFARGDTGSIGLLDLAEHCGSACAALVIPLLLVPLLGVPLSLLLVTFLVFIPVPVLFSKRKA